MSWGERSCIHINNCPIPEECEPHTCNIKCRKYEWDKKTAPDMFLNYGPIKKAEEELNDTK